MTSSRNRRAKNVNLSALSLLLLLFSLVVLKTAEAVSFAGCDHTYNLNPGTSYLESPYYPNSYPANTACRYKFVAPLDYEIEATCTINLDKYPSSCSTEYFYVARDGDQLLRGAEQLCGQGTFTRKSIFRSIVFAYVSRGSWGRFRCQLNVKPQACDCGWSVNTKIVGGQEAGLNEYPSAVAILDKTSFVQHPYCGGTIISHYYVLTAAHCAAIQTNPANIRLNVGEHNMASTTESRYFAQYNVAQIIPHPGYTSEPTTNDIALLRTTAPIEWSRGVGPACLVPPANAANTFAYQMADVIGWGTLAFGGAISDTLQKVQLMITEKPACQQAYQQTILDSHICTLDISGQNKDSCQFDSGGPVILRSSRQFLLGIISFGQECGSTAYAIGVNTRITSYLNWIYQNSASSTCTVSM